MKPGGGRGKGNAFERKVAQTICKTLGREKSECYRTPSSGGHRYAKKSDPGDLVMSADLRRILPFHIECKHYRKVELWHLLPRTRKRSWVFFRWIQQAIDATPSGSGLSPMVVFKGNGKMPILCAFPYLANQFPPEGHISVTIDGEYWVVAVFQEVLKSLTGRIRPVMKGIK